MSELRPERRPCDRAQQGGYDRPDKCSRVQSGRRCLHAHAEGELRFPLPPPIAWTLCSCRWPAVSGRWRRGDRPTTRAGLRFMEWPTAEAMRRRFPNQPLAGISGVEARSQNPLSCSWSKQLLIALIRNCSVWDGSGHGSGRAGNGGFAAQLNDFCRSETAPRLAAAICQSSLPDQLS